MNHFSRLGTLTVGSLTIIAGGVVFIPLGQAAGVDLRPVSSTTALLVSSFAPNSAQGYLGVGMRDVDSDRAAALRLKEARGAEIISIDQDAPVAESGLKIHDVVVQMNGQRIESVEQFRRLQREMPPGRTIALVAMRDGQPINLSVRLADRAQLATKIIGGLDNDPSLPASDNDATPTVVLPGDKGHDGSNSGGFFGSLSRNRYYVGVDIQPLPTGLADYFGVKGGVLVGNVFSNSPGAAAGLKPADVIQKVNGLPIVTLTDWEKAIRANRGKRVQVTIIRDHKEQTLSMVAGHAKTSSKVSAPVPDPRAVAALREQMQ